MNNKIENSKTEVAKGPSLNERDYMMDLLSTEKALVKDYTVAMTEASNEKLYQFYKDVFNELILLSRKIYELMFKNGWYCLEKAESAKVNEKITKLNQEITDINNV